MEWIRLDIKSSDIRLNPEVLIEVSIHGIQPAETHPHPSALTLKMILSNHDLFVDFMEYLKKAEAPPYLHFIINVDSFQNVCDKTGIHARLRKSHGELKEIDIQELMSLKKQACEVFDAHFVEGARYYLSLDKQMIARMDYAIKRSGLPEETLDPSCLLGAEIFSEAYNTVMNLVEDQYVKPYLHAKTYQPDPAELVDHQKIRDRKKLISDLASCKARIMEIDEAVEKVAAGGESRNDAEIRQLSKERQDLALTIENLTKSINKSEIQSIDNNDTKPSLLNLPDFLAVKVVPHRDTKIMENANTSSSSVWDTTLEYVFGPIAEQSPLFDIYLWNNDNRSKCFKISRTAQEFQNLHIALQNSISKTAKVPFPQLSQSDSKLSKDLERYLEMIISDSLIKLSPAVLEFLGDHDQISNNNRSRARSSTVFYDSIEGSYTCEELSQSQISENVADETCINLSIKEITDQQTEMLIDSAFALISEAFDLSDPDQWLRRKFVLIFKELLKQAYGESLGKSLSHVVNDILSERSIIKYICLIRELLYPNGVFLKDRPFISARTEDQKTSTRLEAQSIFINHAPEIIQSVAGLSNSRKGMKRLFMSLQNQQFNKALIFSMTDIILKLLFFENPPAS